MKNAAVATMSTYPAHNIYNEISNVLAAASSHNLDRQHKQAAANQYYSHFNGLDVGSINGRGSRNTLATKSSKCISSNNNNSSSNNKNLILYPANMMNSHAPPPLSSSNATNGRMSSMNSTIYPHKSIVMARHGETMNVRDRGSKLLNTFGMSPSIASSKKNSSNSSGGTGSTGVNKSQQQQVQQLHTLATNQRPKKSPFHHQNHHSHHQQQQHHAALNHVHAHQQQQQRHTSSSSSYSTSSPGSGSMANNAFVMTALVAAAAGAASQQVDTPASSLAMVVATTKQQQQLAERAKLVNEYLKQIFDAATLIIPQFLYLGGHSSVKNADSLYKMGITHVLNMAQELKLDPRKLAEKNIKLMHIAAKDAKTYNIRSDFDAAFKFIDDALINKGKIVINCARGISRSATIVIAYLMFRYKMSLADAFSLIVRLRPQVRPNSNFRRQLQLYEQELIQLHNQQQQQQQQKYASIIAKNF